MKGLSRLLVVLLAPAIVFAEAAPSRSLSASEAKDHIGETATVCGKVSSARFASDSRGQPTFLNLDKPFPNQVFTVVIWGVDRDKFEEPEKSYKGRQLCISGLIGTYRGTPQIVASTPSQIRLSQRGAP